MSVQRGVSKVIFSVLGIFILLTAVIIVAAVLGSNSPVKPLIYKTIELRKASGAVERANLISSIDDLVIQVDNEDVSAQWDRMMYCLSSSCPDEAYLDMVLVVVSNFEQDVPNGALLINLIAVAKYWNNEDQLLDFSKALSMCNEQVELLDDKKAGKCWDAIIECNDSCESKWDSYFDLIGEIVK